MLSILVSSFGFQFDFRLNSLEKLNMVEKIQFKWFTMVNRNHKTQKLYQYIIACYINKPGTARVGAISKTQKARRKFINCKKVDLLGF